MKKTLTQTEHINILTRALDIQKYQFKIDEAMLKRKILIQSADNLKDYIDKDLYNSLRNVFDGEINSMNRVLDWLHKNDGKTEMDYAKQKK